MNPTAILLTGRWEVESEAGWITRQVAGALAWARDVHVFTLAGQPSVIQDGVFTLHRVGPSWEDAIRPLGEIEPETIVVAGHRGSRALAASKAIPHSSLSAVLALVDDGGIDGPGHETEVDFGRLPPQTPILTVTEAERLSVLTAGHSPAAVHRIGAPLAANPSALEEPNPWVAGRDYVLVITGVPSTADGAPADFARLLRTRFPGVAVAISDVDAFRVWHRGQATEGWPIEHATDMARLLAWARVTIDLRSHLYFSRTCIESLLYGTPIVVPSGSRAREHAERGRGGLWFENAAELAWCVEAMLEDRTRSVFGAQGRAYALDEFGSTRQFIDRVLRACAIA